MNGSTQTFVQNVPATGSPVVGGGETGLAPKWWRDEDVFLIPLEDCGRYWRDGHAEKHGALVSEYAARIATEQMPPIIVSGTAGKWHVHDGYHRVHAAHEVGLDAIPAITVNVALARLTAALEEARRA